MTFYNKPLPFSGFFIGFLILLVGSVGLGFTYFQASKAHEQDQAKLLNHAVNSGLLLIDPSIHSNQITPEFENTPEYAKATATLRQFQLINDFTFVYTCLVLPDKVVFVLDPTPPGQKMSTGIDAKSHVLQPYKNPPIELLQAFQSGQTTYTKKPYKDEWGTYISAYAPLKDTSGKIVGVFGVDLNATDYMASQKLFKELFLSSLLVNFLCSVTAGFCVNYLRKKAFTAIKLHEESESRIAFYTNRFKLLVELIPLPAVFVENGKLIPNQRLKDLVDLPEETSLALDRWFYLVNKDNPQQVKIDYTINQANNFNAIPLYKIMCKSGPRYFNWVCYKADSGQGTQEIWLLFDVTDRYITEFKFSRLFDVFQEPLIICDDKFNIKDCNPALLELLHTKKPLLLETNLSQFTPGSKNLPGLITKALEQQDVCKLATKLELPFGNKYVYSEVTATKLQLNEQTNYILSWHDLTEQLKYINSLKDAQEEATASTRAKSQFLATISHEIRTPMNGVIGTADLLSDTNLTPIQTEFVDTIKSCGTQLIQLINEILDFSKIEAGKLELNIQPFSPVLLAERTSQIYLGTARSKNLKFNLTIDKNVPSQIDGDELRIQQILSNLISNALKFTSKGSIDVLLQVQDNMLRLSVKDTGIGIPLSSQSRLFQPFSQVDQSNTRKFGGTGLGLAIAQKLANLMEGYITVLSKEDEGSTFTFWLPLKKQLTQPLLAHKLPTLTVYSDNQALISQLAWLYNNTSSVLLINPSTVATGPVLCDVAAYDKLSPQQRDTALVAGGDPNVHKHPISLPFSSSVLAQMLSPSLKVSSDSFASKHPHQIMLVEDNPINMKVLQRTLEQLGYSNFVLANNGQEAVNLYRPEISLIFMDMQMPLLSGTEATMELRKQNVTCWICALTANAYSEDRKACELAGMNDFLPKPLTKQALCDAIEKASLKT
jgi:signal transduction histidine kinase